MGSRVMPQRGRPSSPPDRLPANFFDTAQTPDRLPADFFVNPTAPPPAVPAGGSSSLKQAPNWSDRLSNFAGELVAGVNPLPALEHIYKNGWLSTLRNLAGAQRDQAEQAKKHYDAGNYTAAAAKTLNWLIPVVGPSIGDAQDKFARGEWDKGMGASVSIGLGVVGPKAVKDAVVKVPGVIRSRLNPVETDAIKFADRESIPVDAATRSGSRLTRNVQTLVQNQPGGSGIGQAARQAQTDALTQTGERLAQRVSPGVQTGETAGRAVQSAFDRRISEIKRKADIQYKRLRDIANRPANVREIEVERTTEAIKSLYEQAVEDSVTSRLNSIRDEVFGGATEMTGKLKRPVNPNDPWDHAEVEGRFGGGFKNIFPELDNFPEPPGLIAKAIDKKEGALYNRLRKAFRNTVVDEEGGEIRKALKAEGVDWDMQDVDTRTVTIMERIALPVDLKPTKTALRLVAKDMAENLPITDQRASKGLHAINQIINGPDLVSATAVDRNLGAIKELLRGAESADLRNISQGLAARAVRELEFALQKGLKPAGPEAARALRRGRVLTQGKWEIADVAKKLGAEPVETYRKLTLSKDAHIDMLREVAKQAPEHLPKLGRAYLEGLFETATAEGGFGRSAKLFNDWQNLGSETKKLLFKNPAMVRDLDNFFLLAKRISENPNPSGSALVGSMVPYGYLFVTEPATGTAMVIGNNVLARMLFTPAGSRVLTNGLKVRLGNKAAAALAATQILKVAGKDAVAVANPGVAQTETPSQSTGQQGRPATGAR
jgi:hypothetical protein